LANATGITGMRPYTEHYLIVVIQTLNRL